MDNSIYKEVTDSIIQQLENGALPWIKPWKTDSTADKNMITQAPYRGVNRLMLGMASMIKGYDVPVWATFKQWNDLGCRVRAEEKGTKIVKYGTYTKTGVDKNKNEIEFTSAYLTTHYVYNACQVEGVTISAPKADDKPFNAIAEAEARIVKTGAVITHGGDSAFYASKVDKINVPHKSAFDCEASYYATMFHELVHWTGNENRLNRTFGKRFADSQYAFEELVAEMGAAFLCQDYRIQGELRHAGYLQSWLKVLKEDSKAIFKASALAQKAVDHINGLDCEAVALPLAA